jgi:hypothetical protein
VPASQKIRVIEHSILAHYDSYAAFSPLRLAAITHGTKGRLLGASAAAAHLRQLEPLAADPNLMCLDTPVGRKS